MGDTGVMVVWSCLLYGDGEMGMSPALVPPWAHLDNGRRCPADFFLWGDPGSQDQCHPLPRLLGGGKASRQQAGVAAVGNTQALWSHRLAEGCFNPPLGSLGQGGTSSWRGEPLGDGGCSVCVCVGSNEVLEPLE